MFTYHNTHVDMLVLYLVKVVRDFKGVRKRNTSRGEG